MTETTDRIRWVLNEDGKTHTAAHLGYAPAGGTVLFRIYAPDDRDPAWIVVSDLPGQEGHRWQGDDPGELKTVAERWLEEFAASIGAIFPDALREIVKDEQARQVEAVREAGDCERLNRCMGWADALSWVLALTSTPASPEAAATTTEGKAER